MGWLTLARLVKLANAKLEAYTLTVGGQLKGKKNKLEKILQIINPPLLLF